MSYTITVAEAQQRRADAWAPPVVVANDPSADDVGAEHGRVLPLVGAVRPYVYDVSFAGGRRRVYADDPLDVIAVMLGEPYQNAAQQYRTAVAGLVEQELELTPERSASDPQRTEALSEMLLLRHVHADGLRVQLQQQINERARRDGLWAQLDEEERGELERAADPDGGGYPVGVLYDTNVVDDEGQDGMAQRGYWSSTVRLVINTGDYVPYTDVVEPESDQVQDVDGYTIVVPGDPNFVRLDVTDDDSYLQSLENAGVVTVTTRQVDQPDPIFQALADHSGV